MQRTLSASCAPLALLREARRRRVEAVRNSRSASEQSCFGADGCSPRNGFCDEFFQQLFRCCPRLGLPPMSPHSFGRAGRALSDSSCHRTLLSFFIVLEHLQEALGVAPTAARRMSCTCCRTQGGEPQGSRSRRWWSPGTQQFDPLLARLRLRRLLDGHRTFDLLLVLRDAAASSCVSSGGTTETARDFTLAPLLFIAGGVETIGSRRLQRRYPWPAVSILRRAWAATCCWRACVGSLFGWEIPQSLHR